MRWMFRFLVLVLLLLSLFILSCSQQSSESEVVIARTSSAPSSTSSSSGLLGLALPPEPKMPGETESSSGIAGRAFYAGLADLGYAEPTTMSINKDSLTKGEDLVVTAFDDDIIYKYYYVSIKGNWKQESFPGEGIGNSNWLASPVSASFSTDQLSEGENYVIAYSCSKTAAGFDCHNNKWQIHAFQVLLQQKEESSSEIIKPQCSGDQDCPSDYVCTNNKCIPKLLECSPPLSQDQLVPAVPSLIPQNPVTKQTYIDYLLRQPHYYGLNPPLKSSVDFHEFGFYGDPKKNIYLNGGIQGASNGPNWALQGLALAEYYKKIGQSEKAKAYFQKVKDFLLGPGQFKEAFDQAILNTGGDGSLPIRRCWFVGVSKDNVPVASTAKWGWGYQNCQDFTSADLNNWAAQNGGLQNPQMIQLDYKNPKGGYHTFLWQPEQIELEVRALEEAAKTDPSILNDQERNLLKDMIFKLDQRIRVWGYGEEVNDYEQLSAIYQYDPVKYAQVKPVAPHLPPRKEYWRGNHHRAQSEGMMKRLGAWRILNDKDATDAEKKQAQAWLHYADIVWNDWWPARDTAFDETSYSILNWLYYVMLGSHLAVHQDVPDPTMKTFWDEADKSMKPFWDRYMNTITPDGFAFPLPTHDGFTEGDPTLLWMMELLASETKDGRYKWAAHRIMNDLLYQESQGKLSMAVNGQWSYYAQGIALAYLLADDSVVEVEPSAGSQKADGRKIFFLPYYGNGNYDINRDLAAKYFGNYDDDLYKNYNDPNSPNYDHGYVDAGFVVLKNQTAPSKFFFKSGNRPGDFTVLVETAARDGPPHDPGGIAGVSMHGSLLAMPQSPKTFTGLQNMLSVEDPSKTVTMVKIDNPDGNIQVDNCYMESEAPAFTDYRLATHAILKTDNYLCFPMTNEREFFFVKNRFMVVRDRATSHFNKPFDGILKEIWYTETISSKGSNWADTYIEKPLYKDTSMANPPWNLLVYHAPKQGTVLSSGSAPGWLNWLPGVPPAMPQQVSYDQAKTIAPETPEAFTYILLPHDPAEKAEDLASSINVLVDTLDQIVIHFGSTGNQSEWVVLNEKGAPVKTAGLETDARQLYLQIKDGKVDRILAVEASYLVLDGKDLFKKDKRITVDGVLPSPECLI